MASGRASSRRCSFATLGSSRDRAVLRGPTLAAGVSVCNEGETGDFCVTYHWARRLRCSGGIDELRAGESGRARALPRRAAHRRAPRRSTRRGRPPHPRASRRSPARRRGGGRGRGLNRQPARLTVLKEAALDRAHMGAAYALDRAAMAADEEAVRGGGAGGGECLAQRRPPPSRDGSGAGGGGGIAAAARLKRWPRPSRRAAGAPGLERRGLQLQARRRRRRRRPVRSSARRRRRGHAGGEPRRADDDSDGGGELKSFAKRSLWQALPGALPRRWRATGVASPPITSRNSPRTFRWCASSLTKCF